MVFTTVPAFSQVSLVNMADRYVASGGIATGDGEIANSKLPKVKAESSSSAHPSTLYRIGAHDLLKIEIVNANVRPRILRVGGDGCIVFPLAGEDVCIAGKTAGEAEAQIASAIKLFERTAIKIEVLDRTSHVVNIAGLVDQPGEQQIMRDAVPFFVVRAGLTLNRAAKGVRIVRNASEVTEDFALSDARLNEVFVYPGDTVEFF